MASTVKFGKVEKRNLSKVGNVASDNLVEVTLATLFYSACAYRSVVFISYNTIAHDRVHPLHLCWLLPHLSGRSLYCLLCCHLNFLHVKYRIKPNYTRIKLLDVLNRIILFIRFYTYTYINNPGFHVADAVDCKYFLDGVVVGVAVDCGL